MKKVLISFHIKHCLPQSANRNYCNIGQDDIKLRINVMRKPHLMQMTMLDTVFFMTRYKVS